jgi:hypothetical protein
LWSIWPAYSFIHGYYYSEQIGALLTVSVTVLACYFLRNSIKNWQWVALFGLFLGGLINVRASSLLVVLLALFFMMFMFRKQYKFLLIGTSVFLMAYATMPLMSFNTFNTFVPFTTQGGFALHEGTFLPGDDLPANHLRTIPEFQEIERKAEHLNPLEKDRYYKDLAIKNVIDDPLGQVQLLVKKSLRFWFNIPGYSWVPTMKSLLFGLPLFLLWLLSLFFNRTRPAIVLHSVVISTWAMHALVHSEYMYSYVVFPLIVISVLMMLKNFLNYTVKKHDRR